MSITPRKGVETAFITILTVLLLLIIMEHVTCSNPSINHLCCPDVLFHDTILLKFRVLKIIGQYAF